MHPVRFRPAALSSLLLLSLFALDAHALPGGGQVSFGAATVTQSTNSMIVRQDTQNAGINWQRFGINSGESVTFIQPNTSAIALNRVMGGDPSLIFGQLTANGQVWLLNPNGILFGGGAQVNVGGLVASTLGIGDADFISGRRTFTGNPTNAGLVANFGTISTADRGYVALLGGRVSNEGVIQARLGTVALAAGNQITLDFVGDQLMSLQIDQGTLNALVENKQLIRAEGGQVLMTAQGADAVLDTVVNNQGIVEAQTIDNSSGAIRLLGGRNGGTVNVGGALDASAPAGGNGGFISVSGNRIRVADDVRITTAAPSGLDGRWVLDPATTDIAAGTSPFAAGAGQRLP